MAKTIIHYTFTLNKHVGFPPATVVAAVDVNDNDVANEGEFIRLSNKKLTWTGTLSFKRAKGTKGLAVLTNVLANVGASYTMTIRKGSSSGKVLKKLEGQLHRAPQVLITIL